MNQRWQSLSLPCVPGAENALKHVRFDASVQTEFEGRMVGPKSTNPIVKVAECVHLFAKTEQ
jgi:hypothetical protein